MSDLPETYPRIRNVNQFRERTVASRTALEEPWRRWQ